MCDEELVGCYYCTRRRRSEARSTLVELETRRSESNESGSGSIGSGFLWGCWPRIKLYCGSGFRMVLDGWDIGGFGFVAKDFGISLNL